MGLYRIFSAEESFTSDFRMAFVNKIIRSTASPQCVRRRAKLWEKKNLDTLLISARVHRDEGKENIGFSSFENHSNAFSSLSSMLSLCFA